MLRRSSSGLRSLTLRPPSRMSPEVMSIIRLTIRIAVVLPQPDGPTSTQISPAGTFERQAVDRGLGAARIALRHIAKLQWLRGGTLWLVPHGAILPARGGHSYPGGPPRLGVGGVLERVVERRELARDRSARRMSQSANQAFLGSSGPCRYVPMTPSRRTPSAPEAPVLPWPLSTRPSGCSPAPRCVWPAWFSKPARTRRAGGASSPSSSSTSIATLPIRRGPSERIVSQVDEPEPRDHLVGERVAVAEQLVAAADAEHERAAVGGGVQRLALGLDEVQRAQALVAVLAAAEVEEVVRVGVDALAEPGGGDAEADPAPGAAPLEHEQVAAVGVDVHDGRDRARRRAGWRSARGAAQPRNITTLVPTCSSVSAMIRPGSDRQAGGAALGLDLLDRDAIEVQDVVAGAAPAAGA